MYRIKFKGKYVGKGNVEWCFRLVTKQNAIKFESKQHANDFISYMGLSIYDSRIEVEKV